MNLIPCLARLGKNIPGTVFANARGPSRLYGFHGAHLTDCDIRTRTVFGPTLLRRTTRWWVTDLDFDCQIVDLRIILLAILNEPSIRRTIRVSNAHQLYFIGVQFPKAA